MPRTAFPNLKRPGSSNVLVLRYYRDRVHSGGLAVVSELPKKIIMPYKSKAQAAYFNIHKKELEKQGVDVNEWNEASKGKKLPERKKRKTSGVRI